MPQQRMRIVRAQYLLGAAMRRPISSFTTSEPPHSDAQSAMGVKGLCMCMAMAHVMIRGASAGQLGWFGPACTSIHVQNLA